MNAPIDWTSIRTGNSRVPCPSCGKGPRDRTCGVTVAAKKCVAHCFRCHYVETNGEVTATGEAHSRPRLDGASKRDTLSDAARDLYNDCTHVQGVGTSYLRARNDVIPPRDGDLRFHPALKHPSGYIGAALVALVTHAQHGHPMSLHRSWINADGTKANVDPPRMLLGGHTKQGGVIRLWPDDAVQGGLGVAEGIETALSLAHVFRPVWALIDAGNLAAFPALPGIESLSIAADHDLAGLKAAKACAQTWLQAGREVRVVVPPKLGCDLNDIARAS